MARTRTTFRVKQPPAMIPTEIDTPPAAAAASIAVTETSSEPGSAEAFNILLEKDKSDSDKSDSEDDDTSVKPTPKKSAKRRFSFENTDDDDDVTNTGDDKPVILEADEESEKETDEEEVVFLGTSKPPAVTHLVPGNSHRNISMTYCVGNVNFGKAYGQFMMVSNGFDQNGSPRHTFRNYLLEVYVKNGTCYVNNDKKHKQSTFAHPASLLFFSPQENSLGLIP
jgi:hypothetical protein